VLVQEEISRSVAGTLEVKMAMKIYNHKKINKIIDFEQLSIILPLESFKPFSQP
jgi:hypothetical protein